MKSRSKWKHWLFTGLALVSSAASVHGQTGSPYPGANYGGAPGQGVPGGSLYGMGSAGPASYAVPGPPPGELQYIDDPRVAGAGVAQASFLRPGAGPSCDCCSGACDVGAMGGFGGCGNGSCGDGLCADCGGTGCLFCGGGGCEYCGGAGGCRMCGGFGGRLGLAPIRNMLRSGLGGQNVNTDGCMCCGWGNNCLLPGRFTGLLGKLAPYGDGAASQRWFDLHVGTIGLSRQDNNLPNTLITTQGIAGNPVLRMNDVDIDGLKWGLLTTACLQTGPGSNLELTYFGLNKWDDTATVASNNADLYSVFSNFGIAPPNGFDDTDRSISQSLTYQSKIHNAELSFRRRMVAPQRYIQGSWLAGIRYFDLDEDYGFQAIGQTNNGLNNTLRFFNMNTQTRNQLVGFQVGSDLWASLVPGVMVGIEGKSGVYGNHNETDTTIRANSVTTAREARSSGDTAYLNQIQLMGVYRVTYSWTFRASYNWMKINNVALAPRNFHTEGLTGSVNGAVFGPNRNTFIDTTGDVKYTGLTLGAEYLW